MQSIFKNAFDKVSVIKEVVEHSIEEAVRINSKDSNGVFNSGTSISSTIVSWAEKNNVSEKANNIKTSATTFVGDLATGLKGMTSNISIQNVSLIDKLNKNQLDVNIGEKEYDYFSDNFDLTDDLGIINTEVSKSLISNNEFSFTNVDLTSKVEDLQLNNEATCKVISLTAEDEIKSNAANFDIGDEFEKRSLDCKRELNDCKSNENKINSEKYMDKIKDGFHNSNKNDQESNFQDNLTTDGNKILEINSVKINTNKDTEDCIENHSSIETSDSNVETKDKSSETKERNIRVIQKTENNSNSENSSILNPLSIFQQIEQLEKQNTSLKNELELFKNESSNLNNKLKINEKLNNNLNHKNIVLMNEVNSLTSRLKDLEEIESQCKSKILNLECIIEKKNFDENLNKEQTDMIKLLQEKVIELEEALELGEVGKIESLRSHQNEIAELRQKLSQLKDKENEISLPYINRINILENQLTESRKRHSNELQRFEVIMENLKNQLIKEKDKYSILQKEFKALKDYNNSTIEKYQTQISNLRDTIEKFENKTESHSLTKNLIKSNFYSSNNFSVCKNSYIFIKETTPSEKDEKKNIEHKTQYFQNPFLFQISNKSSIANFQEEIKQAIHDKQLLEEEYLQVCENKKQIDKDLHNEKQKNKLLQQQLDNMLKLIGDLTEKLDESNETINLQRRELQSIHSRFK